MNKFRAYGEDELPNLEFRSTKEEALADAVARAVADGAMKLPHPPSIIVEEVRDANLSDFVDTMQIISAMRELMQEKIGNDDALSDGVVVSSLAASLRHTIEPAVDRMQQDLGVRIDGYIVISTHKSRDWHGKLEAEA